jgi:hypothetical protein
MIGTLSEKKGFRFSSGKPRDVDDETDGDGEPQSDVEPAEKDR